MSKGLEALEDLSKLVFIYGGVEQYKTIEKELKALEIIKEKPQATLWLIQHCHRKMEYEDMLSLFKEDVTKEQFELLKEVLL